MNNKGFAITTILFGMLVLFCLLLVSLLGILASYKNNMEKLIENRNGARDVITMTPLTDCGSTEPTLTAGMERGLYCYNKDGECKCRYISNSEMPN